MVSKCYGDSMKEIHEFCYLCDTRKKNAINEGGVQGNVNQTL